MFFIYSVLSVLWYLGRNVVVQCRIMPLFVLLMFPLFFYFYLYCYFYLFIYSFLSVFASFSFLLFFDRFFFFDIFCLIIFIFCYFCFLDFFGFWMFLFSIRPLDFLLYLSLFYLVRLVLCSCLCSLTSLFFAHVLCVCRVEVYGFCY